MGKAAIPDEIRGRDVRLLERTTRSGGENIFSTSRPSPIDSVIDHSVEAWRNRRKQSTGTFELSPLTKRTRVHVNDKRGAWC